MHWIRWNDFVPASDQLLRKELLPEAEKALGIKINLETVNGNDLQPRITSAIQSGAGPDVFMLFNNHPQLYCRERRRHVATSPTAIGKAQGGYYDLVQVELGRRQEVDRRARGPSSARMIAYRKSWFDEIGSDELPRDLGEVSRRRQEAQGQGPSARPDARPHLRRRADLHLSLPVVVGRQGDREGRQDRRINKKEAIESVKFMTAFWKDAHDEGGLAWDDTNNNRAFLSQTISATLNGASIYIESLRKPDKYITEKGEPLKNDILHAPLPKGPAGQFAMHTYFSHAILNYSKNQKAAKDFLKWIHRKADLRAVVRLAEGLRDGADHDRGRSTSCGTRTRDDAVQGRRQARPGARLSAGPPARRPPRCSPSTSSPTCTRKPSRA